jgi:hypothetical protein
MTLPNSSTITSVGASGKVNYQGNPPSDPSFDWDNTLLAPAICDIANASLTDIRLILQVTLAASTGAMVLNNWWAVWQNATPTTPIMARTTTGIFTFTMPVNVSDQYTQSIGLPSVIPVNLQAGIAGIATASTFAHTGVVCSTNVVTLYTANATGSANDLVGTTVNIFVR